LKLKKNVEDMNWRDEKGI